MHKFNIQTQSPTEFVDITKQVQKIVDEQKWSKGVLTVFSPHTTGGITLNENWDPDVQHDMLLKLNEVFPDDSRFQHNEGNSHSHIKTSMCGNSAQVIVENGQLQLGRWQGIYFAEWDGPRSRQVWIQFVQA